MSSNEIIIGIDLGTTNSLVAFCDEHGPRIIRDADGESRVPSFLTVGDNGNVTIGSEAKAHAVENPTSTIFSVKRLMGRGYDELVEAGELAHLPYQVVKRSGSETGRDLAAVDLNGQCLTPPELSAMILRDLKARAERDLGRAVHKAVITVPAYFDDAQRQATRDAGRIAGLEVVRIVNEPTAAALAYGLGIRGQLSQRSSGGIPLPLAGGCDSKVESQSDKLSVGDDKIVAVYDLGGGTFDVSILRLIGGIFEVLSTHGDTQLGGDDLDREIIGMVQRDVHEQFGVTIDAPATKQALRTFAENVKIRLSSEQSANVEIDLDQGRSYKRTLSREEFESMISPWIDRTLDSCRRALKDAKLMPDQIDQVVLVGGSTRIPLVRRRVEELFGREPYTALDPDEVVALGAAAQAAILSGARTDTLLLDVIPLSLGIETMGGAMSKLILRNTRIPCQQTERFSTFVDGQTAVKINVLQGERELVDDCRSLGEFELRDIPPMPAGLPRLLVKFLVDENGILNVSALEERSGKKASIQIVPAHGLTEDEVDRMERDAYAHARDDMTAHQLIDLRNQIAFDTEKAEQMLAKVGSSMDDGQREAIETAMRELRDLSRNSRDADTLNKALKAFDAQTVRLAELAITETLRGDDDTGGA